MPNEPRSCRAASRLLRESSQGSPRHAVMNFAVGKCALSSAHTQLEDQGRPAWLKKTGLLISLYSGRPEGLALGSGSALHPKEVPGSRVGGDGSLRSSQRLQEGRRHLDTQSWAVRARLNSSVYRQGDSEGSAQMLVTPRACFLALSPPAICGFLKD